MALEGQPDALRELSSASTSGVLDRHVGDVFACLRVALAPCLNDSPAISRTRSVVVADDRVTFASGASFPRDTLLTTNVEQQYRLDVLCFFAIFVAKHPGVINAAAYLKAR